MWCYAQLWLSSCFLYLLFSRSFHAWGQNSGDSSPKRNMRFIFLCILCNCAFCSSVLFSDHWLSTVCLPSWQRVPRKAQSQRVLQPQWFSTVLQQPPAMALVFDLQLKLWPPRSSLRWPAKGQNWACPYSHMWSWPHSHSLRADDASHDGEIPSQSSPAWAKREINLPLPSALDVAVWERKKLCVVSMDRCGAFLFSHMNMYAWHLY